MIFISDQDVLNILNWTDAFRAIRTALVKVSERRVVQKPRTFTEILNTDNLLLTMPGYLEDAQFGALACKLVTVAPNNPKLEKPLPTINANVAYFDQDTGVLRAVIAGTEVTKWRTATASVVATDLFLNKSKKSLILTILGCGVQGKIHAEAFFHFFNFTEIRLWNRHADKASRLAEELNEKLTTDVFKCLESNEQAVREADVIVTATFAPSPIVKFEWVKEGTHINAVGAGANHHSELDDKLYANSDVYIDHWAGARQELSGLEKLGVKFKGEIGSCIIGDLKKSTANRITVFQSLGMAAEDCAMARLVYDKHTRK